MLMKICTIYGALESCILFIIRSTKHISILIPQNKAKIGISKESLSWKSQLLILFQNGREMIGAICVVLY